MNRHVIRLYGLVVILFALLAVFTTRWTVIDAESLADNTLNRRQILQKLEIRRGTIRAADGTVLARAIPAQGDTFKRAYPTGSLFAQAVGFSDVQLGVTGLEKSRDDELTGTGSELSGIVDGLSGSVKEGDDLVTTLDPGAQQVAYDGLAGRPGAVVAIEPATGAVKVMAGEPSFDPGRPKGAGVFNRATQSSYPPGSTMKVLTAAAALDSGKYTPDSVVDGSSPKTISGVPLNNDGNAQYGPISLTVALTNSVNTVWGQVAESLGTDTYVDYMRRFGFFADPPLDYPDAQMRASGVAGGVKDVGRVAIGQGDLLVTPLQMAMVVSAVANGGVLMKPRLTDRIVDPDGRTVSRNRPEELAKPISAETAAQLNEMMQNVVNEGTGTAAALDGVEVAGKTGTAQVGAAGSGLTQPWFVAFAPASDPQIAIAVTVERTQGGFGGTVAGPIAKAVMEDLLADG